MSIATTLALSPRKPHDQAGPCDSPIERPRRHPTRSLQTIAFAGRPRPNAHPCSGARARAMGFALFSQGELVQKARARPPPGGSRGARPPGPVPEHGCQHGFPLFTVTYIVLAMDSDIAIGFSPVAHSLTLSRIHCPNIHRDFESFIWFRIFSVPGAYAEYSAEFWWFLVSHFGEEAV